MKWLYSHRFLILRRIAQIGILLLFIMGNASLITIKDSSHLMLANQIEQFESGDKNPAIANPKTAVSHILTGNLSASKILDFIPLSDPLAFLQILLAGGAVGMDLVLGVILVTAFYGIFLGRGFCAFICPINPISDLANFLRRILGIKDLIKLPRKSRYGILALSLALSFILGTLAWECISPIASLHRSLIFGIGSSLFSVLAIFLWDLFIMKNGFCGHLCPLGATYSLIGSFSLLKVKHIAENCTHCMRCVKICPEPQVLWRIGKSSGNITSACIKCGRCIEVCQDRALEFSILNLKEKK